MSHISRRVVSSIGSSIGKCCSLIQIPIRGHVFYTHQTAPHKSPTVVGHISVTHINCVCDGIYWLPHNLNCTSQTYLNSPTRKSRRNMENALLGMKSGRIVEIKRERNERRGESNKKSGRTSTQDCMMMFYGQLIGVQFFIVQQASKVLHNMPPF